MICCKTGMRGYIKHLFIGTIETAGQITATEEIPRILGVAVMTIRESAEDYLETILILQKKNGYVRSIDIAGYLSVSKPSVSRAMGLLRDNGYIQMDEHSQILLTPLGQQVAGRVYDRHRILTDYLIQLGLPLKQPPKMPAVWSILSVKNLM